jgi:methionyl-tRNA formyltransferase
MKIILFGSVPLATWVLKQLLAMPEIEILGVVCDDAAPEAYAHHGLPEPSVNAFRIEQNIPRVSLEEVETLVTPHEHILGVSVRFNRLLRSELLDRFKFGVINLHGGDLPRYRGTNIANHMILEGATRGAGTVHFIDAGVDTGDVVERVFFDVTPDDTAEDVFHKTLTALEQAFQNIQQHIVSGILPRTPQSRLIDQGEVAGTYRTRDLSRKRIVPEQATAADIDKIARAFAFGTHEPAYLLHRGRKIYVTPLWNS